MKKTLTINLNGIVFHIDEDAYQILQNYLNEVDKQFHSEEDKEILKDIEARIAELFSEKLQNGKNVIEEVDVKEVMEGLGHPDQFAGEDEEKTTEKKEKTSRKNKRFYRDPENYIFGGIASGAAAYLNWDVTLMRFLFVILVFIGFGWIIPIYIIAWLVAPKATTTSHRLEVRGEDVTINNIKSEFKNAKNYVESDGFKHSAKKVSDKIANVIREIVKGAFIFISSFVGFAFLLITIGIIISLIVVFVHFNFTPALIPFTFNSNVLATITVASAILLLICPIIGLFSIITRLVNHKKRKKSRSFGWILFAIWITSLLFFITIVVSSAIHHQDDWKNHTLYTEARGTDSFNEIEIDNGVNVVLQQGEKYQVSVQTPEQHSNNIKTEIKDSMLHIYVENFSAMDVINNRYTVIVTTPNICKISICNGGKIESNGVFSTQNLSLNVSAMSCAKMNLNISDFLSVETSELSKTELKGYANKVNLHVSEASKIDAEKLQTKTAYVLAEDAAKAYISVSDNLWMEAQNAAQIEYKGNPTIVKSITNTSSIKRNNK